MKIYSVFDPEFKSYGHVVTGLDDAVAQIMEALAKTPLPAGVGYVPSDPLLQPLQATQIISDHCYGGMPVQMGWCNGHNTMLNCLEYHRDSEFNLGVYDFILLLARQDEIEDGKLDTAKVKAFRVPAGVLIECYANTLHYAPCHADPENGYQVLIALPWLTNTDKPEIVARNEEDKMMTARNKWLIPHESLPQAKGMPVVLVGQNIDIAGLI